MPATALRFLEASGLSVCCALAMLTESPKVASSLGELARHASNVLHVVAQACSRRTIPTSVSCLDVAPRFFIVRSFICLRSRSDLWAQRDSAPARVAAESSGRLPSFHRGL